MPEAIQVQGLAEFRKALREVEPAAGKLLRRSYNEAGDLVVDWARRRVEVRSGRAQRSIRSTSTQNAAWVTGGGVRVPYYPWVDFGGWVGRLRSVRRSFLPDGRYIYPGYAAVRPQVEEKLVEGVKGVARSLGWEVTDGG